MNFEDLKVKQIYPAHADHISCYKQSFIDELFKQGQVIAQRKYDGERMLIHFNGKETYCTSRRTSKKTGRYMENQDKIMNLPTLERNNVGYTVIDCEFYGDTWSDAVGILHSLPERAFELQKKTAIHFACFDCLFFNGVDLRSKSYIERLTYMNYVLGFLSEDARFHPAEQFNISNIDEAYELAQSIWDKGGEGIVIKPLSKAYYDKGMMLKIKRFETLDVAVCGYQEGRGKYQGTVGALNIGYFDPNDGTLIRISKVNCGTDEDRAMWKRWFDEGTAYGKVIEVKCQEITDKSLRHPVYLRLRDDKSYQMCTKETIFKEQ